MTFISSNNYMAEYPEGVCDPNTRIQWFCDFICPRAILDCNFGQIYDTSKFYLLPCEDGDSINFFDQTLQSESALHYLYGKEIPKPLEQHIVPGLPVMAKCTINKQDHWFRSTIVDTFHGYHRIFTIDSGRRFTVHHKAIRFLRKDLLYQLPAQAILAETKSIRRSMTENTINYFGFGVVKTAEIVPVKFLFRSFNEKMGLSQWLVEMLNE